MRPFNASIVCGLLFMTFSAVSSCQKTKISEEAAGPSDSIFSLETTKLPSGETHDILKAQGTFAPTQRVQIKSDFAGRIEELPVGAGQMVAKGDLLVKFDEENLLEVLEGQRAQLQEAEEQLDRTSQMAGAEAEIESEMEEPEEEGAAMVSQVREEMTPVASWVPPSGYWVPVPGRPEDAGGVWPEMRVGRNYSALSQDPADAGGIWPDYGPRRRVLGDKDFTVAESEYLANRRGAPAPVNRTFAGRPTPVPTPQPQEEIGFREETEETERLLTLDQAKVDRIQSEILLTERQIFRRSIVSPIGGLVEKLEVKEDSEVEADALLAEIVRIDPIDLILEIPKGEIGRLEKGQEVAVHLPNQPGEVFTGEISFIGVKLEKSKEVVEVRARIANPDYQIRAGMEGVAEIAL